MQSSRAWWGERRLRYNIGLVVAGLLAFAAYVAVVDRGISNGTMPGAEISGFTTLFQGLGYLIMMALANVCYNLGPLSESVIKPKNTARYRLITFRLGFWFSVLLPFAIPAVIAWWSLIHPGAASLAEP